MLLLLFRTSLCCRLYVKLKPRRLLYLGAESFVDQLRAWHVLAKVELAGKARLHKHLLANQQHGEFVQVYT